MELGLTLGDRAVPKPSFGFMEKARDVNINKGSLGFCMALSVGNPNPRIKQKQDEDEQEDDDDGDDDDDDEEEDYDTKDDQEKEKHMNNKRIKMAHVDDLHKGKIDSSLVQLDLLPNTPVPRQIRHTLLSLSSHNGGYMGKGLDVNRVPVGDEEVEAVSCSPPNSGASSFQMDFCKNGNHHEVERASSRASDEDENGCARKKLRLSKQQSAFLEESFKEHTTLNPKQKLALAKHLNLRPRQVEVWFQNRRARTKLKQTEVDCEYLKKCCETLTEENRRLHKEVQELRTLKSSNPFYMQLPATTLTMCPSCKRVATTSTTAATTTTTSIQPTDLSLSSRPRFHPFNQPTAS